MKNLTIRQRTPGHYLSLLAGADTPAVIKAHTVPGLRGVQKRYLWNKLEPVKGQFDFSEITADLAYCESLGLKLVVMLLDKTFFGPQHVMPKGMEAYEAINHGGTSSDPKSTQYGGYTALRWSPVVVAELNALTAALGAAFDLSESFEGLAFPESSTSMDITVAKAHGYTPEAYRDAMINYLTTAAKNLPHSQVFWYMNFLAGGQQYLAEIIDVVRRAGVSVGGPDILPNSTSLVTAVYPLYEQFKGRVNLFGQMSTPGYSQVHADGTLFTMQEMLDFAREVLYLDYIFWMPNAAWAQVIPLIAANPTINF